MLVVRGTKKLRDRVKGPATVDSDASTGILGDWFATALFWKPQVALLVNARTFLPVFMPLAPAPGLLQRVPEEIARILAFHGVDPAIIDAERGQMADVRIAPTNDRSVVGVMNEFAFLAEHWFEGDLTALSVRMAGTPVGPLRGEARFPDQALAAIFSARPAGPGHPGSDATVIPFPGVGLAEGEPAPVAAPWYGAALAEPRSDRGWPWRSNLRLLQSWWRSELLGAPPGPGPSRSGKASGAWLPLPVSADDEQRNFFDDRVLDTARRRLTVNGWGGLVKQDRLLRSLLSSQPVCFNLFGVLQHHPEVLLAWLRSLDIDAVAIEPTDAEDQDLVRLEYAPPKKAHLDSGSAFDACITYRDSHGRRGVVAVETKYAENLADQKVPAGAKYEEATRTSGLWKDTAISALDRPSTVQCWQNLLLVQKAVELRTHGWERGTFVMVADGRDRGAARATAALWSQLHDPSPWVRWSPYQDIVALARLNPATSTWADWFTTRYLDLSPTEGHLLDDPNRNPVPIGSPGDTWATDEFRDAASSALAYGRRVFGDGSIIDQLVQAPDLKGPTLAFIATADHLRTITEPMAEVRRLAHAIHEATTAPDTSVP